LGERNIRKLSRVGSGKTYTITLPIEAIRELGWQKKQKLVVEPDFENKRLVIKDWED
jgi:bifunctional DNA-binding transcriptional regulator/antitoxin component of YhaV-PrlF toxin-antitoxin module